MAKTFLTFFKDYAFKQFISLRYPLTSIATRNMSFNLLPVQGTETTNNSPQYNIQIEKRIKWKDSVETPLEDQEKTEASGRQKGGTNFISRLNNAVLVQWETQTTKISGKRELIVRGKKNYQKNWTLSPTEEKHVASLIKSEFIEHEERIMDSVWQHNEITKKTLSLKDKDGKITSASIEAFMAEITKAIDTIEYTSDEYKHMTEDVIILLHPKLAKYYADLQGRNYHLGTNTFGSGFLNGFHYNGHDYITSKIFNSMETDSTNNAEKTLAAIILDKEAILDAGVDTNNQNLNQQLFNDSYTGKSYAMLTHIVFPNRIAAFDISQSELIAATPKVSD